MPVQWNLTSAAASATSGTCTFTSAQTAGNTNVVFFDAANFGALTPVTCTDTSGNTYTQQTYLNGGTGGSLSMWCFVATGIAAAAASANTVTVTVSSASNYTILVTAIAEVTQTSVSSCSSANGAFGGTTASTTLTGTSSTDACLSIAFNRQQTTVPTTGLFGSNSGTALTSLSTTDSYIFQSGTSSGGTISATAGIVSGSEWSIAAVSLSVAATPLTDWGDLDASNASSPSTLTQALLSQRANAATLAANTGIEALTDGPPPVVLTWTEEYETVHPPQWHAPKPRPDYESRLFLKRWQSFKELPIWILQTWEHRHPPPRKPFPEVAPYNDATAPWGIHNFGAWTNDPFAGPALTKAPPPDIYYGNDPSVPPVTSLSELSRWADDPFGRQRSNPPLPGDPDFAGSGSGRFVARFIGWSVDTNGTLRPHAAATDVPYTGNTLGWAPTEFQTWTPDSGKLGVRPTSASDVYLGDPLSVITTLSNLWSWSNDSPRGPGLPRPVDPPPYTGNTLGWAPTEFQSWTLDSGRPTSHTLPPSDVYVGDPLSAAIALLNFVGWANDAPARSIARQVPADPDLAGSGLGLFASRWLSWSDPGPTARRSAANLPDVPFVGTTLGWAPVEFQTWTNDLARTTRKTTLPADPDFSGSGAGLFTSRFLGWSTDPAGVMRPRFASADVPYTGDPVSASIALGKFIVWGGDLQPFGRTTARAPDVPYTGDSIAWASVEFARWVEDPVRRSITTQRVDEVSFASIGGSIFAHLSTWSSDPVVTTTISRRAPLGDVYLGDPLTAVSALSKLWQWSNDASRGPVRHSWLPADPFFSHPLPILRFWVVRLNGSVPVSVVLSGTQPALGTIGPSVPVSVVLSKTAAVLPVLAPTIVISGLLSGATPVSRAIPAVATRAKTLMYLTASSPPYTALTTDFLIEVDTSDGALQGPINLSAIQFPNELIVKYVSWSLAVQSFQLTGGSTLIDNPSQEGTFVVGTVPGCSPGGSLRFLNDGTRIILTGAS
jgi:hypothetical protein